MKHDKRQRRQRIDPARAQGHHGRRSQNFLKRHGVPPGGRVDGPPPAWRADHERIFACLSESPDPIGAGQIAEALHLDGPGEVRGVQQALRDLKAEGRIMEPRPGRFVVAGSGGEFPVTVEDEGGGLAARFPDGRLLPLHPRHRLGAQVGDRAVAMPGEGGTALLTRLVDRRGRRMVGTLVFVHEQPRLIPDNRRDGEMRVLGTARELSERFPLGVRVLGEVVADGNDVAVRLDGILDESSPEIADFTQVVAAHDLPGEFPEAVVAEAGAFAPVCGPEGREDLRQRLVFTIDPTTAKDFDDAISLEALPGGGARVGVHIADVSSFVSEGTALDDEAMRRGTSVYLVNRVIPMLPERLSNGLCSLVPDEDRWCLSVFLDLDASGRLVAARPAATIIRSRHRLDYGQALEIILNKAAPGRWPQDLVDTIHRCHAIAQGLRAERVRAGALNLYSVEHEFALDVEGSPIEVERHESDVAHQLIEELMLLANRAVAKWLADRGRPCVYRVHDEPDEEKLGFFATVMETYGLKNLDVHSRFGLQNALQRLEQEPPTARLVLNLLLLRCFQKAIYAVANVGHHALAFRHYCHFTSPIRRYPDLLVHRLVKRELGRAECATAECRLPHLDALARQCSWLEQRAEDSERALARIKAARYLAGRLGDEFAGVVTGASRSGLHVQLLETGLDGLIPMRALGDDFYNFDPERLALVGRRTGRVLGVGMECNVSVVSVRIPRGEVDLEFVRAEPARRSRRER